MAELEEAPDVADVGVGHREVRPLPVHPHAEPARLRGLHAGVLGHAIAAGAREAVEPVGLDLVLRVEPERLLDLDLDPQALAVEAVLVALILAERGVVALEQVLQRAPPRVVHAHRVVRRDRAVDERERRPALVLLAQPLERPVAVPALEHAVLERDVVGLGGDGSESRIGGHRPKDGSRAHTAVTPAGGIMPARAGGHLALDATQISSVLALDRGGGHAAPVCLCARRRRAHDRAGRDRRCRRPAESCDRHRPRRAAERGRRRGGPERRRPVPAHGDGLGARLVGRGLAGCDASAPRAVALRRSAGPRLGRRRPRLRLGPRRPRTSIWSRRPARATASARPATTASSSPPPTMAGRIGTRRCRSRTGAARTETIEPAIAADRTTPGRVYIAYSRLDLRGCQLHRQPAGLRDLPDLLHERRGLVVPAQARVAHLPFRHRSLP